MDNGPWTTRTSVRSSIAAQLATNHGHSWLYLDEDLRGHYLADADALIDQGMTPFWENPTIPEVPSPELEAEIFAFECAMTWFQDFIDARHPDWRETGILPASHIEEADPQDWDAWISVAVTVSETARQLWSRRLTETTGTAPIIEHARHRLTPPPPSAPAAIRGGVLRDRIIAAAGATLAHRHGRRWLDLPGDARAAYARDIESLMALGLVVT
jgi:hypothetical protein